MNSYYDDVISTYQQLYKQQYLVKRCPRFSKIIFNPPATIILWDDGTKTVVKCQDSDAYDQEKGMAMAICKKALGNKGNYYNMFKQWLPKEDLND